MRLESLSQAAAPGRVQVVRVTFKPGARTAWHSHPLGRTLILISGRGLVQVWGRPAEAMHPGDVVSSPPGEKHWHGATPDGSMTHIAIQEALDGKAVNWMEKVSDDEYRRAPRA